MRLREAMLWRDPPTWYGSVPFGGGVGPLEPPAGLLTYDDEMPAALLAVPKIKRGALPLHHYTLIHEQLKRFRSALFVARTLGRALVLPRTLCSCEIGFWPNHIEEDCKAGGHKKLTLPYVCPIDHYLDPPALEESKFLHRERSFFDNPRTPPALPASRVTVRVCANGGGADAGAACELPSNEVGVAALPSARQLRESLGKVRSKVLHLSDAVRSFGSFDSEDEARDFHRGAQELLSSWCCTADERFKRIAGVVPYLLPPLPGQAAWRGDPNLAWAAEALGAAYAEANQSGMAPELRAEAAPAPGPTKKRR